MASIQQRLRYRSLHCHQRRAVRIVLRQDCSKRLHPGCVRWTAANHMKRDPIEILLVEDNQGDALVTRKLLEEHPRPIKLHHAKDGMEALMMLASSLKPDLIILDLNMPTAS